MSSVTRFLAEAGLSAAYLCATALAAVAEAPPSWHFFSGTDLTKSSVFVHHGMVWSPGSDLHQPGWRLRGLADGGTYRYRSDGVTTTGRMLGLELMPGYSWFNDRHGLTLYLGGTISHRDTNPRDTANGEESRFGVKVLAEGWVHLTDSVIVDASAGYGTASRSYTARLASTISVSEWLVLEPEIAAFGEPGYDQQRAGILVELHRSPRLRVMAGGGWSRDRDGSGAYFTVRLKGWR